MNTYGCLLVPQAFSYSSERLLVFTSASGAFTWAWTEASPPSWQIQMSALWKTATVGLAAWVIWETLLQCFGSSASMHSSPDFSSFTMPLLQRNLGGQADQQCQGPDPKWPEMTMHQTSATLSWTCKQRLVLKSCRVIPALLLCCTFMFSSRVIIDEYTCMDNTTPTSLQVSDQASGVWVCLPDRQYTTRKADERS